MLQESKGRVLLFKQTPYLPIVQAQPGRNHLKFTVNNFDQEKIPSVKILRRTKCSAQCFRRKQTPIFHFEETFFFFLLRSTVVGFSELKQEMKYFIQDAFCPLWCFSLFHKLIKPII